MSESIASASPSRSFEVIIVGAGMVGLSCALALVQQGFHVAVVEAGDQPQDFLIDESYDPKVVAITRASEHLFKRLGVWSAIKNTRICAYHTMQVWDSVADGEIVFDAADFFEPDLGHIVEQRVVLAALWQALKQADVCLMTGVKVNNLYHHSDKIELTLVQDSVLSASLVIAADGSNSCLRGLCQIMTVGWDYKQNAIVATVEGTKSHHFTAFQRFAPDGPLALLPLSDSHKSSIVWTTNPAMAEILCHQSEQEFNEKLTQESNGVMGQMKLIGKRYSYPLRTHHAKQYAIPRCVLVGDAAHSLHPLAGQGVNLGLLDCIELVEILVQAKKSNRDFGALNILQRYERKRRIHNQIMIWAMELFKRGFGSQSLMIQRLRNFGLNWVDKNTGCKQLFAKIALGKIGLKYDKNNQTV